MDCKLMRRQASHEVPLICPAYEAEAEAAHQIFSDQQADHDQLPQNETASPGRH